MDDSEVYHRDDWPTMPDGNEYNGKHLLTLLKKCQSPFKWDVNLLIREIEGLFGEIVKVIDIPLVKKGRSNYGFHLKLSHPSIPNVIARLSRYDLNTPNLNFNITNVIAEESFEIAVYNLLTNISDRYPQMRTPRLLYSRIAKQHNRRKRHSPRNIDGRTLFVFEKEEGRNNVWGELTPSNRSNLLAQSARITASLFNYNPPTSFISTWLLNRLFFSHKPDHLPTMPISPTREFCLQLLQSLISTTIQKSDIDNINNASATIGPNALAAQKSLLRLVPYILPPELNEGTQPRLYRFVLEHGDYGIHNMSIKFTKSMRDRGHGTSPLITSVYDWEAGCIVPAILSDPSMAVDVVDLTAGYNGVPTISRVDDDDDDDATPSERAEYTSWATDYIKVLYKESPEYQYAIAAGNNARYLWFALRDWNINGDNINADRERYFGELGAWADTKLKELGIVRRSPRINQFLLRAKQRDVIERGKVRRLVRRAA